LGAARRIAQKHSLPMRPFLISPARYHLSIEGEMNAASFLPIFPVCIGRPRLGQQRRHPA
jgi:hypothetical protein